MKKLEWAAFKTVWNLKTNISFLLLVLSEPTGMNAQKKKHKTLIIFNPFRYNVQSLLTFRTIKDYYLYWTDSFFFQLRRCYLNCSMRNANLGYTYPQIARQVEPDVFYLISSLVKLFTYIKTDGTLVFTYTARSVPGCDSHNEQFWKNFWQDN